MCLLDRFSQFRIHAIPLRFESLESVIEVARGRTVPSEAVHLTLELKILRLSKDVCLSQICGAYLNVSKLGRPGLRRL